MNPHLYGVILAGGSGTRFWPLSRERFPKQLLRILGEGTLLQQTFERLLQKIPANRMVIVTNAVQAESIKLQLNQWKDAIAGNVILEPEGRNTGPAIALAALQLMHQDPEAIMVVVPADHVVKASKKFMQAVQFASELAEYGHLVTFGIHPTRPETGYGYIQPLKRRKVGTKDNFTGYPVARFVEKPNLKNAQGYCRSGNYFWNSGIFIWKASQILSELAIHQPALSKLLVGLQRRFGSEEFSSYLRKVYDKVESLSIDNAVMEHSTRSVVVPVDFGWSDVGSWGSLEEVVPLDKAGNVRNGNIIDLGSRQSVLFADRRLVATIGLDNMVVVDTPDATLVCPKNRAQDVKAIVNLLKQQGAPEHLEHRTVHRPWGAYTVLEEGKGYKVKRIEVSPGKRLSLQLHHQRSEHWVVITGTARVTRGEEVYDLQAGMSTGIAMETPHRLENPGQLPLEIIEIQNGPYLGEDDIVRLQDDFGRLPPIGQGFWEKRNLMGIFREYDIRGIVELDLTPVVVERIGRAYATLARERGVRTITVGRDGRLSSSTLRNHLIAGLLGSGINVVDLGLCATPLLYFSLFSCEVEGGIMITGSHNAAEYNGFKMCVGKEALYGNDIQQLRKIYESGRYASGKGVVSTRLIIPDYLTFLQERFSSLKSCGLRVVIDCGNGAASLVAKEALEQLGCQVTGLYCELDGHFPNHHPDPTVMENLRDLIEKVKETGADVGIGYDGDADRIGVIDEQGQVLWGDRLLLLFARNVLLEHPGCTIISEVKASQSLYNDIQKRGGRGIMWKTGHSIIKAKMKEEKALLAGEMSGHLFFADRYYGYDDAIYASCRLIEILVKQKKALSSLLADIPPTVVTPEIRVDCPDDEKFLLVESVKKRLKNVVATQDFKKAALPIRDIITIDGIRVCFDEGWGLIRASNTQPALVLRFEASSHAHLTQIQAYMEGQLSEATADLIT